MSLVEEALKADVGRAESFDSFQGVVKILKVEAVLLDELLLEREKYVADADGSAPATFARIQQLAVEQIVEYAQDVYVDADTLVCLVAEDFGERHQVVVLQADQHVEVALLCQQNLPEDVVGLFDGGVAG